MRRITVDAFASQISAVSDAIPVVVKDGPTQIAVFPSLFKLPVMAEPGVLEAKINFVTVTRDQIVIQITPKAYNTVKP